MAKIKATKIKIRLSIILITTILSFPLICLILFSYTTTPNTYILDQDFSLLTKPELTQKINSSFLLPETIDLKVDDTVVSTLNTASISAQIDVDKMVQKTFYTDVLAKLFFFSPRHYFLNVAYQSDQLDELIRDLKLKIDQPFVPPQIDVDYQGSLSVIQGSLGRTLDDQKFTADLLYQLSTQDSSPISLTFITIGQLPTDAQIQNLLTQAQNLKGKQITLNIPDSQDYTISDTTLISWLGFYQSVDTVKISTFVDELNQNLKRGPVDAVFKFENGKVSEFKSSSPGRQIDIVSFTNTLQNRLLSLTADPNSPNDPIDIPFVYTDPQIKNEDANDLGIKELLGRGDSSFKHSSTIRNSNVKRGAEVVNYILVPPGDTFSFNQNLGEVSVETGYKMAYVIREGRTELDVGGGICQVSTTLFRAILNAGLPIVERRPHAYRVSYYEEGSKPGFDATVFLPSPDLKFQNDTAHHILIQSIFDGDTKALSYEIYGTSDGRQVTIDNYRQWDYAQPPPDKFIDDPTLAPGQLVQVEQRIPGLKTAFDWTVTRDGQILHQQTFSSSYTAWAAVYRRGPTP